MIKKYSLWFANMCYFVSIAINLQAQQCTASISTTPSGTSLNCKVEQITLMASCSNCSTTNVNYAWSNGVSIEENPISRADIYTVTINDENSSCTASITITQDPIPNAAGPNVVLTCAQTTLPIGTPNNAAYTYMWQGPGNFTSTLAQPMVSQAGTYTVTVTHTASSCTAVDHVEVSEDKMPPDANAGPDKELTCAMMNANIGLASTTPDVSYNWSGPIAGNLVPLSVNMTGTYTLTVTKTTNGCTATDEVVVSSNKMPPVANAGPDKELTCSIPNVNIGVLSTMPGVTYNWIGAITGTNVPLSVNQAGTYTLTVIKTNNGCTATDEVTVTANKNVTANAGNGVTLTCTLTALTIGTDSLQYHTYSWRGTNGFTSTLAKPKVTQPATYTVTATNNNNGCTATSTVTISQDITLPMVNSGGDKSICKGMGVTLSATSNGTSFLWGPSTGLSDPAILQPVATPFATTTYTLTATGSNGCTANSTTRITVYEPPKAMFTETSTIWKQYSFMDASVKGTGSLAQWEWTFSGGNPSVFNGQSPPDVKFPPGDHLVTLRVIDSNGCSNTTSKTIRINPTGPCNAKINTLLRVCAKGVLQINAASELTVGVVTWQWAFPSSTSSADTNTAFPKVSYDMAGTYPFTLKIQDANGCKQTIVDTVVVNALPNATLVADKTNVCMGSKAVLTVTPTGNNSTLFNINMIGPNGFALFLPEVPGGSNRIVEVSAPVSTGKYILSSLENQNTTCKSVNVAEQSLVSVANPQPKIMDPGSICEGTRLELRGDAGAHPAPIVKWTWQKGANPPFPQEGAILSLNDATLNTSGDYRLSVIDANGCTGTVIRDISIFPKPKPTIAGDNSVCQNQSNVIYKNNTASLVPHTNTWSIAPVGNADLQQKGDFAYVHWLNQSGIYTVTLTEKLGECVSTATLTVTVGSERAPDTVGIYWAKVGNLLIAKDATAQCYQWGYTDTLKNQEVVLQGEIYQTYVAGEKYREEPEIIYWVDIWKGNCNTKGDCATRSFQDRSAEPTVDINEGLRIFPNPNMGDFVISLRSEIPATWFYELYDMHGRLFHQAVWPLPKGEHLIGSAQQGLDLISGTYVIKLSDRSHTRGKTYIKKIVIQR